MRRQNFHLLEVWDHKCPSCAVIFSFYGLCCAQKNQKRKKKIKSNKIKSQSIQIQICVQKTKTKQIEIEIDTNKKNFPKNHQKNTLNFRPAEGWLRLGRAHQGDVPWGQRAQRGRHWCEGAPHWGVHSDGQPHSVALTEALQQTASLPCNWGVCVRVWV